MIIQNYFLRTNQIISQTKVKLDNYYEDFTLSISLAKRVIYWISLWLYNCRRWVGGAFVLNWQQAHECETLKGCLAFLNRKPVECLCWAKHEFTKTHRIEIVGLQGRITAKEGQGGSFNQQKFDDNLLSCPRFIPLRLSSTGKNDYRIILCQPIAPVQRRFEREMVIFLLEKVLFHQDNAWVHGRCE